MKKKSPYSSPECVDLCISEAHIVCQSPQPGGIEGIDYEDWNE